MKKRCWSGATDLHTGSKNPVNLISRSFEDLEDGPGFYTVQFQVFTPPSAASQGVFSCQAQISWAVDGKQVFRVYDVTNGLSVSGCGESVSVQVYDTTPDLIADSIPSLQQYTVSCNLTPGTRPAQGQPPTLQGVSFNGTGTGATPGQYGSVALGAGDTVQYKIPAGAISVEVVAVVIAGGAVVPGDIIVDQSLANSQVIKAYDPLQRPGFVNIAANTTLVTVKNNAAAQRNITLTWGIDG